MKQITILISMLLFLSFAISACGSSVPTTPAPTVEITASMQPGAVATTTPTMAPTVIPFPSDTPTLPPLQLEVVQTQTWTDRDGNLRTNFLLRNPYDFPVAPSFRGHAKLMNKAGAFLRDQEVYFLDGLSGGLGFILPGETIAAFACFTCERTPLKEEPGSVDFLAVIADATDKWKYSTDVKVTSVNVSFDADSPIFFVNGTVQNNSASALSIISARVFVYDQAGKLAGIAEGSAMNVAPGAAGNFRGTGFGQKPDGAVKYEVTALGVSY